MSYLQKTIEIAGSQSRLASKIIEWHKARSERCTLSQQGVSKWIFVPAEHCRAIEDITNGAVTRYDLRPDVFGTSPACDCTQSQPMKEAA